MRLTEGKKEEEYIFRIDVCGGGRWLKEERFSFISQIIFSVPRYSMDTHIIIRFCLIVTLG